MKNNKEHNMLVGLDIGASKVVAVVAETSLSGKLNIIGIGSHSSTGLKKGVVVNFESIVASIQRAIEEAELMAGCNIYSVYMGIDGNHIENFNSLGVVAIETGEVLDLDIERVIDAASAVVLAAESFLLHILPQGYSVDGQKEIGNPLGMFGVRLETNVRLVSCAINAQRNLENCIRRNNLRVQRTVLNHIASSYSVLTEGEKELGICLLEMGHDSTNVTIFLGGTIRYIGVIPIAGRQITKDIAMALCTSIEIAEKLKVESASIGLRALVDDYIEVKHLEGSEAELFSRKILSEIVSLRCEEILSWVHDEIHTSQLMNALTAGIVLTGGTANLSGISQLSEKIFSMPVRIGRPINVDGLDKQTSDPAYATVIGLLKCQLGQQQKNDIQPEQSILTIGTKVIRWIKERF